jgi:hypothetical protein
MRFLSQEHHGCLRTSELVTQFCNRNGLRRSRITGERAMRAWIRERESRSRGTKLGAVLSNPYNTWSGRSRLGDAGGVLVPLIDKD